MKLCYMYDDAFIPMRDHFLANLKDEFELISLNLAKPHFGKHVPETELYGGGIDVWLEKPNYLLRVMEQCEPDEYFIYSDVDIVFFKPILPTLNKLLGRHDLLFLREIPEGLVPWQGGNVPGNCNFGFCVIRACERTRQFFLDVINMIEHSKLMDQTVVNKLLYDYSNDSLTWDVLPIEFTTTPFMDTHKVDRTSLMFHAICCIQQQDKFNMMEHAKTAVRNAQYTITLK